MKKNLIRYSFIIIILISYIIVNKGFNKKGYSQKIILDDNYDWKCAVDDEFLNISKYEKNVFNIIAKKEGLTEIKCSYNNLNNNDNNIIKIYNILIDSNKKIKIDDPKEYRKFNFETAYGSVNIVANYALTATGFAGASNTIFYLKDNSLYLYIYDGDDDLLASGVNKIYYENDSSQVITAILNKDSNVIKNLSYINYVYAD